MVPTAAAILLAAQLFCQAAKMAVHAGAADCRNMMSPDNALARAILLASAMAATLVGLRSFPNGSRRLPACQTILNAIGNLLADGCQVEKLLLDEGILGLFGKLQIHGRLLPKIVIPVHNSSGNRRAVVEPFRQARPWTQATRLPNRGRPRRSCETESAGQRDPFLGRRFRCSSRLCRKLEHCCLLIFKQVSQEHDLPVWKFQRIMMCVRVVLVDLPEERRRVIDLTHFAARKSAPATPYLRGKSELRSRKNANCRAGIFGCSEPSSAGIEVVDGQFVANLGRT